MSASCVLLALLHVVTSFPIDALTSRRSSGSPAARCAKGYNQSAFNSVDTRGDGIGTALLDRLIKLAVAHRHGLLPSKPVWSKRAGSKECFGEVNGPCVSLVNDALWEGLVSLREGLVANQSGATALSRPAAGHLCHLPCNRCPCKRCACTCPRNGRQWSTEQVWALGTTELSADLPSYVGRHFGGVPEPLGRPAPSSKPRPPLACVHQRLGDVAARRTPIGASVRRTDRDEYGPLQSAYTDDDLASIADGLKRWHPGAVPTLVACDSGSRGRPEASMASTFT